MGEKEDPSTIMRCLAENWKKDDGTEGINEKAINDCRDCFKGIKGSLSKAKECVAQHLPAENGNCTSQIDAFQSWDDKEKGMEVLDCFDKTLERIEGPGRKIKREKTKKGKETWEERWEESNVD